MATPVVTPDLDFRPERLYMATEGKYKHDDTLAALLLVAAGNDLAVVLYDHQLKFAGRALDAINKRDAEQGVELVAPESVLNKNSGDPASIISDFKKQLDATRPYELRTVNMSNSSIAPDNQAFQIIENDWHRLTNASKEMVSVTLHRVLVELFEKAEPHKAKKGKRAIYALVLDGKEAEAEEQNRK